MTMLDDREADLARENAELRRQLAEALAQQQATGEVLQVINSSPDDLAPVFDAMLERAIRLCEAVEGILWTIEGRRGRVGAARGLPADFVASLEERSKIGTNPLLERVINGEHLIHLPDTSRSELYGRDQLAKAAVEAGVRTLIWVALVKNGAAVGAFAIGRREVRPFSDQQIALLENFAAQAVIAMENARLITETREALEQQTATAEVLQVINASPGVLAPVFDAMLEKARRLCDATCGVFWTFDGRKIQLAAVHGEARIAAALRALGATLPAQGSMAQRLLRGERVVHVPDVSLGQADASNSPTRRAVVEIGGARTLLAVSLRKDNSTLGFVTLYRQEVRPFSDKQIALLQNFAAQAVIAMENARLITETREALEQQTATAEVLGVINSSPGDLAPVFDAMLEKAMRLCGASLGTFATFDGIGFRAAARLGYDPGPDRSHRTTPTPGMAYYRLIHGESVIHVTDITDDEVYRSGDPQRRRFADRTGARTAIWVALRRDAALLGAFVIYRTEVRPFSDKQIALLQNFAGQAVIAMENARLITETREALEQQIATAEVLQVINSSPGDLAPVFDAILEKAHALCGATHGILLIQAGGLFHAVATHGVPEQFADLVHHPFPAHPGSPHERLLQGESLIHIADQAAQEQTSPIGRASVEICGTRTLLFVALRQDDAMLGCITAYRQEVRPFTEKQIALLQNFAAQAVIAMENARLITETREALDQQTATAEVLGVINSSPGELGPVFDAMLEKAHNLCGAESGALLTYNGDMFRAVAWHGLPQAFVDIVSQPFRHHPDNPMMRLTRGEGPVQVCDLAEAAPQFHSEDRVGRAAAALGRFRTNLMVPLRKDDGLVGVITANRCEARPFSDKQITLLQNFAAQAVIAMENARLITETREALEQQTATAEVLGVINSSPGDLAPVFDAILEKAIAICGAAQGSLSMIDDRKFRLVAERGLQREFGERLRQGIDIQGNPALEALLAGDPFFQIADMATVNHPVARMAAEINGSRTVLFVPLRKDGLVLGTIVVYRYAVQPFSDKQIALLQNFATQAVIAIENARLITETREALEQQTATAEVLGVINSSPGDLAPVFDAMLERAARLCEADFGTLWTFDGDRFHPVVAWGHVAAAAGPGAAPDGVLPNPRLPLGRLVAGESIVHLLDAASDVDFQSDGFARGRAAALGLRSSLSVALRKDDILRGAITVARKQVRRFTDRQIALLQNFAAQAVIAMENARLLGELRQRTEEVAELNRGLEARVAEQVDELGRVGRLKRFLAPQLAELIVSQGDEKILESHRREIVVVFCDLRGFTGFSETAEPEEVLDFLREYHAALGPLVGRFEGTLDHFSGDGIMVFFNDPVPCPDPAERAVNMAVAMRSAAAELIAAWRRRGRDLGFGIGIAQGYATLGQIGFAERAGYTAIGTVCNLAARLCAEAKDGQILVSQRVAAALDGIVGLEEVGNLALKGLSQPVAAFNIAA